MKKRSRKKWFYVSFVVALFALFSTGGKAAELEVGGMSIDFHGYLESNIILRDANTPDDPKGGGFQHGFFNNLDAVQQRNTLKFDVDIDPKLEWGSLSISKIHLTYRGAYDSIFDLRKGAFGDIRDDGGPSRFDFGKRDIKWENDLREGFVELSYRGSLGSGFFRPGRQIVSWGETSGLTILDVINPGDNSFQMFFLNPDDLKIPLWMGRLNHSIYFPGFNLNFDLLYIPDIRPAQFAPLDRSMQAPYAFAFRGLAPFNIRQDVPTDKREYGARVMANIGERLSVSLVYFRDVNNGSAIKLTDFVGGRPTTALLTHPVHNVYGGYFSYEFTLFPLTTLFDFTLKGEFARVENNPTSATAELEPGPPLSLRTFRLKPWNLWMLGADRKVWMRWLSKSQVSISFQWLHQQVKGYDRDELRVPKNVDSFTASMSWPWLSAKMFPSLFFIVNPPWGREGGATFMTNCSVNYYWSKNVYTTAMLMAFWGDRKISGINAGQFSPALINTSEVTFKIGYQW